MKKCLVTGSDGFIGKSLIKRLSVDYEVIGVDRNNLKQLEPLVKQCDIVFHVGAIVDTTLSDPTEMLTCNYAFSKTLFDLAQKYNKKVVYSSSAACYGNGDNIPTNIYGWSKLLAEEYGMVKCDKFVALRYFNVYGPGEEHKGNMSSVAYQSQAKDVFTLFPKKPKRDFVFVDDVVSANVHAINCEKGVYEVGSGEARTFEDVLDILDKKYNYHDEDKIPSWYQFFTKSEKLKWMPGWKPKHNIESGVKKYKEYLDG